MLSLGFCCPYIPPISVMSLHRFYELFIFPELCCLNMLFYWLNLFNWFNWLFEEQIIGCSKGQIKAANQTNKTNQTNQTNLTETYF
jgi:hypothetical protein